MSLFIIWQLAFSSKTFAWCRWQRPLQSCSLAVPSETVRPIAFQCFCSVFHILYQCQLAMGTQSRGICAAQCARYIKNKREKWHRRSAKKLWRVFQCWLHLRDWGIRLNTVKPSQETPSWLHVGSEYVLLGYVQFLWPELKCFLPFKQHYYGKVFKSEVPHIFWGTQN